MPSLTKQIERAKELLRDIHHLSLATVNADGSPHNSPVFAAFDDELNVYWASHPEAIHSQNIYRTKQVFVVVFDSREGHSGLYMRAQAFECSETELQYAHDVLQKSKAKLEGSMGPLEAYKSEGAQRIYKAEPQHIWVNKSERDADGYITRDRRYEITLADLA